MHYYYQYEKIRAGATYGLCFPWNLWNKLVFPLCNIIAASNLFKSMAYSINERIPREMRYFLLLC